jgi:hypothetical protein
VILVYGYDQVKSNDVIECYTYSVNNKNNNNNKAIPLEAWTGIEDSRRLRLPDFKTWHMEVVRSALRTSHLYSP